MNNLLVLCAPEGGAVIVLASETNPQHVEHLAHPYTVRTPPPAYPGHSQYDRHCSYIIQFTSLCCMI
jgi:hypothetical protein